MRRMQAHLAETRALQIRSQEALPRTPYGSTATDR